MGDGAHEVLALRADADTVIGPQAAGEFLLAQPGAANREIHHVGVDLVRVDADALDAGQPFGLTMQGEPEDLYTPLLELAAEVEDGTKTAQDAIAEASTVIAEYTTTEIGTLSDRVERRGEAPQTGSAPEES